MLLLNLEQPFCENSPQQLNIHKYSKTSCFTVVFPACTRSRLPVHPGAPIRGRARELFVTKSKTNCPAVRYSEISPSMACIFW